MTSPPFDSDFFAEPWALSNKARNRLQHAYNGNPPKRRQPEPSLDRQQLQQLQEVRALRAAGWSVPAEIAGKTLVRVYDTRIPKRWLLDLAAEARGMADDPDNVVIVGGDFASNADLTDGDIAVHAVTTPWRSEAAHFMIPPRPHLGETVGRLRVRLDLEHRNSVFTLAVVVERDKCPHDWDVASLRRLVGDAAPLLDDPRLAVEVLAVAERAPVLRVPASERQLPPREWEQGYLPRNKVLLLLHARRLAAGTSATPPTARWIRGALPALEPSALELLRVEYELPPTARQRNAERELRRALAKAAGAVGVPFGAEHRLQGLQPTHGGVLALLAVPRAQALRWLRGSGCGGLFIRPFWTKETGDELKRDRFNLLYLRGRRADAARVWEALHDLEGITGLLLAEKDIAVRISVGSGASAEIVQARLRAALADPQASVRQPTPGASWWRLGPLTDSDAHRVRQLIEMTGLQPLRDEVRFGGAGPFRRTVYFQATGQPTRTSLDDGGWGACAAKLAPATPPPTQSPLRSPSHRHVGGPPADSPDRRIRPQGGPEDSAAAVSRSSLSALSPPGTSPADSS